MGQVWVPGCLQHHDGVLALVGARGRKGDVDVRQAAASRVTVSSACHATHFNPCIHGPGSERFQTRSQSMEL